MDSLVTILQGSLTPDKVKQSEMMLHEMRLTPGFCPNLLNVCMSNQSDNGLRLAAAVQLKNTMKRFLNTGDKITTSNIDQSDKEYIRLNIVHSTISSPKIIQSNLLEILKYLMEQDFEKGWNDLPREILSSLTNENRSYWNGAYLCLLTLVKSFQTETEIISQHMRPFLNIMKNHIEVLFNELSESSVTIQKHILKIFHKYTYVSAAVITKEELAYWMTILCAVSTRPLPEHFNDVEIFCQCRKWALHTLTGYVEKYSNPSLAKKKKIKEFSCWFSSSFNENIIQTLFVICEQYSQNIYVVPKVLIDVLMTFDHLIGHSQSWKYLKPQLLTLVKEVIFKILRYTKEDEELWQKDPIEYCRRRFDSTADLEPSDCAECLLQTICSKSKESLDTIVWFAIEVLNSNEAGIIEKDAALRIIIGISNNLIESEKFSGHLEGFILNVVPPSIQAPEGFRRARACQLIGFLAKAAFKTGETVKAMAKHLLNSIINDPDLPVRVMAACALACLIKSHLKVIKPIIVPNLLPLVQKILTLLSETQSDSMSDILQVVVDRFSTEIEPIALFIISNLKNMLVSLLLKENLGESASATVQGIFITIIDIFSAISKIGSLIDDFETLVFSFFEMMFSMKKSDYYEECFIIASYLTENRISDRMWQFLTFIKSVLQDDINNIHFMMSFLPNYINTDKPSLIADPIRINTILDICAHSFKSNNIDEYLETYAAKLLEMILINYRGHIDEYFPRIMELVFTKLLTTQNNQDMTNMCLQVVIAAIYYNQVLAFDILMIHNWPGSNKLIIDEFVKKLVNGIDFFEGIHDRKMCLIGFTTLLTLPKHQKPQSLQQLGGQILSSLVNLMDSLYRTYEQNVEEDYAKNDDDKKALNSDADDAVQVKIDKSDDESLFDLFQLTDLEKFKTDLDKEELKMTEFSYFYDAISQLHLSDPEWFQVLTTNMSKYDEEMLDDVMQKVKKKRDLKK